MSYIVQLNKNLCFCQNVRYGSADFFFLSVSDRVALIRVFLAVLHRAVLIKVFVDSVRQGNAD